MVWAGDADAWAPEGRWREDGKVVLSERGSGCALEGECCAAWRPVPLRAGRCAGAGEPLPSKEKGRMPRSCGPRPLNDCFSQENRPIQVGPALS